MDVQGLFPETGSPTSEEVKVTVLRVELGSLLTWSKQRAPEYMITVLSTELDHSPFGSYAIYYGSPTSWVDLTQPCKTGDPLKQGMVLGPSQIISSNLDSQNRSEELLPFRLNIILWVSQSRPLPSSPPHESPTPQQ